jgi:hypothetical protein
MMNRKIDLFFVLMWLVVMAVVYGMSQIFCVRDLIAETVIHSQDVSGDRSNDGMQDADTVNPRLSDDEMFVTEVVQEKK